MSTLTTVLAILVALEHLYIMFLETIATSSESTSRVFGISIDQLKSKTIATLLKNLSKACLHTDLPEARSLLSRQDGAHHLRPILIINHVYAHVSFNFRIYIKPSFCM